MTLSFFFNDTPTTEIYTLSLHDALPISRRLSAQGPRHEHEGRRHPHAQDRKSTRLNSSHVKSSYAVCCLKKKKINPYEELLRDRRLHLFLQSDGYSL